MFPRPVTILAEWVVWLGLAYRISASVARERQQATLDSLLTSPIERIQILRIKLWAGIYQGLPWAICSIAYQILGMASDGMVLGSVGLLNGLVYVLWFAVFTAFLACLSVYASVTSKTVLQAQTKMILSVFVILVAGVVDFMAFGTHGLARTFNQCVNLLMMADHRMHDGIRAQDWTDGDRAGIAVAYIVLPLSIFAIASVFFWRRACRSFCLEMPVRKEAK